MLLTFVAQFPWALLMARLILIPVAFTAHELAHALAATALGDPTPRSTGRLTLDPRAHVESIGVLITLALGVGWSRPVPIVPHKMKLPDALGGTLAALAGPLANLALAAVGLAALRGIGAGPENVWSSWPSPAEWLTVWVRLNIGIALFNLLPLFPLDGYFVIHHLLPLKPLAWWEAASGWTTFALGVGLVAVLMMPTRWLIALAGPLVRGVNGAMFGW